MILRIVMHLTARWHEVMADRWARRAGAALNRSQRHMDAAEATFRRLEACSNDQP